MSLDTVEEHPPSAWCHLQPITMGDPCPICGGTEYYCCHMVDLVLSNEDKNFDAVLKGLGELYEECCQFQPINQFSSSFKSKLSNLMDAYSRWLE